LHLQGNSRCGFGVEQVVEHNLGVCVVIVVAAIGSSAFARRYFTSVMRLLAFSVGEERGNNAQSGVEQPFRVLVEFSDEREGASLSPSLHRYIHFVACLFWSCPGEQKEGSSVERDNYLYMVLERCSYVDK